MRSTARFGESLLSSTLRQPRAARAWVCSSCRRPPPSPVLRRSYASEVSASELSFGQPVHETHPHLLQPGERECLRFKFSIPLPLKVAPNTNLGFLQSLLASPPSNLLAAGHAWPKSFLRTPSRCLLPRKSNTSLVPCSTSFIKTPTSFTWLVRVLSTKLSQQPPCNRQQARRLMKRAGFNEPESLAVIGMLNLFLHPITKDTDDGNWLSW